MELNGRRILPFLLTALLCALLLFFTVWAAHAQSVPASPPAAPPRVDTCTGQPAPDAILWSDFKPAGPLQCNGATGYTLRFNGAGVTGWRYCLRSNGTYAPQWAAGTWAWLTTTPGIAAELWNAGPRADAGTIGVLAARNVSTPLDAPELKAVWCPHWPEIAAGIPAKPVPAPLPVQPAWKVAGSTAFLLRAGALAPGAGVAKLGAACDCSKPLVLGLTTYCPFAGAAPDVVARCTR